MVEIDDNLAKGTPEQQREYAQLADYDAKIRAKMSPKGKLNLPPLLDERRLYWGIVDNAFRQTPAFDRIFIFQIPEKLGKETYGDTHIIVPETAKRRIQEETPRGILIGAGLTALDNLESHGISLGHIVSFVRLAPWRLPIDSVGGHELHVLVLRDGDLTASEDLTLSLRKGECQRKAVLDRKTGMRTHVFVDKKGKIWNPQKPWISEDY